MIDNDYHIRMEVEGTSYIAVMKINDSNNEFCRILVYNPKSTIDYDYGWDYVYEYNTDVIWQDYYYTYFPDDSDEGHHFIGNDISGYSCYGIEKLEESYFSHNILPLIRPMLDEFHAEWLLTR